MYACVCVCVWGGGGGAGGRGQGGIPQWPKGLHLGLHSVHSTLRSERELAGELTCKLGPPLQLPLETQALGNGQVYIPRTFITALQRTHARLPKKLLKPRQFSEEQKQGFLKQNAPNGRERRERWRGREGENLRVQLTKSICNCCAGHVVSEEVNKDRGRLRWRFAAG